MRKNCQECPYIIRNRHNDKFVEFVNKFGLKHNCHMTPGVKDFWNINNKKWECYGRKRDNLRSL